MVLQAEALMAANEEVRSCPRGARRCERWCPPAYPGGTNWERSRDCAGAFLEGFLNQNRNRFFFLERFPLLKEMHCVIEIRCLQLATIQRNPAGKALVANVKAKNLEASTVDLLRLVKARCRRWRTVVCAGVPPGLLDCSERGSTRVPPEYGGALLSTLVPYLVCRRVSWHRTALVRERTCEYAGAT